MEKNNSGKMIAIVALIVAVVALSVGFAAFADDLYINGTATANASGNAFDDLVNENDLRYTGTPICYLSSDTTNKAPIQGATVGSFSADGDSWDGISIPLGSSATSITCEATITNASSYIAYLKSLYTDGGLTCTSSGTNSAANVAAVCTVTDANVQNQTYTTTLTVEIVSSATDSITVHDTAVVNNNTSGSIAAGGTGTAKVTVNYLGATIDEDVTITLPTITHHYSSSNN